MTYAPFMKRCPKGHPMEETRCLYCEQDKAEQDKKDDLLADQIRRIARAGKLKGITFD